MLLALPPQTKPNTGSFPQDRDAVRTWMDALSPVAEPDDAVELLRGLRHSNRLINDPSRRRVVLEEFRPTLNALTANLTQTVTPQPLPMAAPFRRASALLSELLREEANTWKILLAQSEKPQLADAAHALNALHSQAVAAVQQYRQVPRNCIRDANQIYAFADSEGLLERTKGSRDASDAYIDALLNAYAGTMAMATMDLRQIRAKQLDLTIAFLGNHRDKVRLNTSAPEKVWRDTDCVVNLSSGERPVPAACYLGNLDDPWVRWLDFTSLMEAVDIRLSRTRTTVSMTLGSDTLERQTLTRLSHDLAGNRARKVARCISYNPVALAFGHQQISNQLLRESDPDVMLDAQDVCVDWTRTNYSKIGAAFRSIDPNIGTAQVGELVAMTESDTTTTLGIVRWVHASDDGSINLGVEFLSNGVVPVELARNNADDGITDEALIIACRIAGKVTQTILLPGYRFHTGDRLTASQAEKQKHIKLGQCLQSNGMFSQFVLSEG